MNAPVFPRVVMAFFTTTLVAGMPSTAVAADSYVSYTRKDSSSGLAGKFNGSNITMEELELINPKIQAAKMEVYREQKTALDEVVRNRVLESMAKKAEKTVDQFLRGEMVQAKKSVTDKDIDSYLSSRGIPAKKTTPKLREQVRGLIHVHKIVADATVANAAEFYLKRPRATPLDPNLDGQPTMGEKDAPLTVVEFADFQCEFCKQAQERIAELRKAYGPKLRIVFKNFPLTAHADARLAAEAGLCVNDQGSDKFWKFHDLAYQNQKALAKADLISYAKKAGAEEKQFSDCLEAKKFKAKIDESVEEAQKMGISATPTFVIGGQLIKGAVPLAEFKEILDDPSN